jgi:hypothetical protein
MARNKQPNVNVDMQNGSMSLSCTARVSLSFVGISYGFQLMRDHESPNVPFTIIRTRFPEGMLTYMYNLPECRNVLGVAKCLWDGVDPLESPYINAMSHSPMTSGRTFISL